MSVELKIRDWDDEEYDDCGHTAIAILKIGCVKIPLCDECVNDLHQYINDFCRPQYCHQCKHFKRSHDGWKYGGSCCRDEDVPDDMITYKHPKGCMDSCEDFMEKEN